MNLETPKNGLCGMYSEENQSNYKYISNILLISIIFLFLVSTISTNPFKPAELGPYANHWPIFAIVRIMITWSCQRRKKEKSARHRAKFPFLDCEILVWFCVMIQTNGRLRPDKWKQNKYHFRKCLVFFFLIHCIFMPRFTYEYKRLGK